MNRKKNHKVHIVTSADKSTKAMIEEVIKKDRGYRNRSNVVEIAIRQFYRRWKDKNLVPALDAVHRM